MYSVGILRDDQQFCNLRYIGGRTADAYQYNRRKQTVLYDGETIFQTYPSPYQGMSDTWFTCDVQIMDNRLLMLVNEETVFDVIDPGNAGNPSFPWKPLIDGGWIGFRNFRPNSVIIDYVKVFQQV